jgi:hypothetical protein
MNPAGRKQNLKASHPGNRNAMKSGVYSERQIAERAERIEQAIPEVVGQFDGDDLAAHEVSRLLALREAIDGDLAKRGVTRRDGEVRSLLSIRLRVTSELRRWFIQLGLTPASRNGLRPQDVVAAAARKGATISPNDVTTIARAFYGIAMDVLPDELHQRFATEISAYLDRLR